LLELFIIDLKRQENQEDIGILHHKEKFILLIISTMQIKKRKSELRLQEESDV
jgi:hypothetical protein